MRTRHNRTVESTVISSRRVLLTDGQFHAARIEVSQGRIRSISALGHDETPTTDLTLAAGFIDLQVNGIDDVDVWSTALAHDSVAWQRMNDLLLDQGVTSWCPTLVTHLFNAMSGVHHREPGLATWALTEDSMYTSLIADGVHNTIYQR